MKISVIVLLTILTISVCGAQTINFGIKAGLNLSEQIHDGYVDYGQSLLAGFNAGGFIDFGFKNFSVQPGLFFTTLGEADKYKYVLLNPFNGGPGAESSTSRLYYVKLPVNFFYRDKLKNGAGIYFGGGPYIAYGFAEHEVITGITNNTQTFGYTNPDIGVDAILGETIKRFLVEAAVGFGVINIDKSPGDFSHNLVISLSGGYMFK